MPDEPQSHGSQSGDISEVQVRDSAQVDARAIDDEDTAVKGVSGQQTGAKRRSFFKDRDYGG